MKRLKIFCFFIIAFMLFFTLPVSAEEERDFYEKQYESSGIEEIESLVPKETNELIKNFGLDLSNPEAIGKTDFTGIFSVIWDFLSVGFEKIIKVIASVIGIVIIFAALEGLISDNISVNGIVCLGAIVITIKPIYQTIIATEAALKGIAVLMGSFVPVYTGIMLSSGKMVSSGSFSTLMLFAAEAISAFISFGFAPLMSSYLSLAISGSFCPVGNIGRIAEFIKKSSITVMGILTTLFIGIFSLQNTIGATADNMAIRTSKAVVGSTIPIMGPAIAEILSTASSSLLLLRSGFGIYIALAIILMALPIALELCLWRLGLWLAGGLAGVFNMQKADELLRSVDFCISVLLGVICFSVLLFVITLTISLR